MLQPVSLGFSEIDITPAYNVQTVGFGRADNLSQGVLHKLYAQVSIWYSLEGVCCVVALDHIGFMCADADTLRDAISKKLGLTRDKVMICFSHTHSAPNISLEPEYFQFLCEQVLKGVDAANETLAPVKAAWGVVEGDIGMNRRNANGALDRRIGILKIVDAETNRLRHLILRVTAHANVLLQDNYLISSDYFGVTRELLEKKYGCKVMLTQGASGNVKPKYDGSLEALDKMALSIMEAIAPCVESLVPVAIDSMTMFSQKQTFHADVPSLDKAKAIAEEAMRVNYIDGTNWLQEVARLHQEDICQQSAEIEIQYFKLNEGCLCGVGNEIMCELALDLVHSCNDNLIFFGGYTNGCDGYLPGAEEYDRGGYEVLHAYLIYYIYYHRVMPLSRETAAQLVQMVADQWLALK